MSDTPTSFPLPCLDIRRASYMSEPYFLLVLSGTRSSGARPIFSFGESVSNVVVDDQGWWGIHEWSQLPQLYDPSSPWLACIPIYKDPHHPTRTTIHRRMIVDAERVDPMYKDHKEKQALMLTTEPTLKETLKGYVGGVVTKAKYTVERVKDLEGYDGVVWPTITIDRAVYLLRRLIVGTPSVNSFKRTVACLRRAVLELEGFIVWGSLVRASVGDRMALGESYKKDNQLTFRGAFLDGRRDEWLNQQSQLRLVYEEMLKWSVPLYALVKERDWDMRTHAQLRAADWPFGQNAIIQGMFAGR